jgi:hypothetical protein
MVPAVWSPGRSPRAEVGWGTTTKGLRRPTHEAWGRTTRGPRLPTRALVFSLPVEKREDSA